MHVVKTLNLAKRVPNSSRIFVYNSSCTDIDDLTKPTLDSHATKVLCWEIKTHIHAAYGKHQDNKKSFRRRPSRRVEQAIHLSNSIITHTHTHTHTHTQTHTHTHTHTHTNTFIYRNTWVEDHYRVNASLQVCHSCHSYINLWISDRWSWDRLHANLYV